MKESVALEITRQTWLAIFGKPSPFQNLPSVKVTLARGIPLPKKVITGQGPAYTTPTYFPTPNKYLNFSTFQAAVPTPAPPASPSIAHLINLWLKNTTWAANKNLNSVDVAKSDNVYRSQGVYNSSYIFNSRNIVFSQQLLACQNLIASHHNDACSNSIRISDSVNSSYCFNVSWSSKIARSLFIHNSSNLYECMFCQNLRSRRYCIANIQFSPEQYFTLKKQIIGYLSQDNWTPLFQLLGYKIPQN